jgi:hypothetical protein
MGKFLNGLCVGIGIGLFIAPQTGQETRRLLMESVAALRKSISSEDDQHFPINVYPSQITTFSVPPAQPATVSTSESQAQGTTSVPPTQTSVSPTSGPEKQVTTSAQPIVPPTNEPEEQGSPSVSSADTHTENTDKLPNLSSSTNTPNQSTRRKASTRISNTSKTRGHNRS